MAMVLSVPTPRRMRRRAPRRHRTDPIQSDLLRFRTANGEDQVSILPASSGGPWIWLQVRSIYGESMQNAEVLLNRRQLRSVVRLLARAARQLDEQLTPTANSEVEAYLDEVSCRAADECYDVERRGIELPEDF